MRPQLIKDIKGRVTQLFATCAKQTVAGSYGYKFTIKRKDLRAALLRDVSALQNAGEYASSIWSREPGPLYFVQLWARVTEAEADEIIRPVFQDPKVFSRVPARYWDFPYENPVLRIGCTQFEGSYARAFAKWALFTPKKKGVKRGQK